MQTTVRLQREEFDAAGEAAALTRGRTDIGALVTFTVTVPVSDCVPAATPKTNVSAPEKPAAD